MAIVPDNMNNWNFKRTAVSNSCAEKRKPPSPETEMTFVLGRTKAAEMAHGRATPKVLHPI